MVGHASVNTIVCTPDDVDTHWEDAKIVCLVGSTKHCSRRLFDGLSPWQKVHFEESLHGHIVLTIGCETKGDEELQISEEQKRMYAVRHRQQISLADEVVVVNFEDYIGEHTKEELRFAWALSKPIRYAFPHKETEHEHHK